MAICETVKIMPKLFNILMLKSYAPLTDPAIFALGYIYVIPWQ